MVCTLKQHQYLLFGWFFETLVFDEHHRNQEYILQYLVGFLKPCFSQISPQQRIKEYLLCVYVSGPGRYLQPRENEKC